MMSISLSLFIFMWKKNSSMLLQRRWLGGIEGVVQLLAVQWWRVAFSSGRLIQGWPGNVTVVWNHVIWQADYAIAKSCWSIKICIAAGNTAAGMCSSVPDCWNIPMLSNLFCKSYCEVHQHDCSLSWGTHFHSLHEKEWLDPHHPFAVFCALVLHK